MVKYVTDKFYVRIRLQLVLLVCACVGVFDKITECNKQ